MRQYWAVVKHTSSLIVYVFCRHHGFLEIRFGFEWLFPLLRTEFPAVADTGLVSQPLYSLGKNLRRAVYAKRHGLRLAAMSFEGVLLC